MTTKERYQRLKEQHKCISCGKEAFGNFVRCAECLEKAVLRKRNTVVENANRRQNMRDRKAKGICRECSNLVCEKSTVYCQRHYELHYLANHRYYLQHKKPSASKADKIARAEHARNSPAAILYRKKRRNRKHHYLITKGSLTIGRRQNTTSA